MRMVVAGLSIAEHGEFYKNGGGDSASDKMIGSLVSHSHVAWFAQSD